MTDDSQARADERIAECALVQSAELDLSDLGLTGVPYGLYNLHRLRAVDLSKNLISVLPSSINRFPQLVRLDVSHNRISELPETIGDLKALASLDVSSNDLASLPASMKRLPALKFLSLGSNARLGLPPEIAALTNPTDILDYYFRSRDARPLNEAKLILVGRGGVGKTSLVRRLVFGRFDQGEKKTDGIVITQWPLTLRSGENVRLHVWDFGGQEIMHATHQFFLSQRSLYLVVLNGREGGEDADVEYWLKLIESFGAESPVIVVMNKIREHSFDLNRRGLQTKYSAIRRFIATDCEDQTGISDLLTSIHEETDRLEHLRDAFPVHWIDIKERLSSMKGNYLTFSEYRRICSTSGEKEEAAQDKLAYYLHVLGVALNFKDDPRLQDTHVLNPHWVTKGIYKILNSESLAVGRGVLSIDQLGQILPDAEYPRDRHQFIVNLMRKFDLCFPFPEDDGRYLVPELLDKQQPEIPAMEPDRSVRFTYNYKILPEGVLPRFIVRSHALSDGLPRWRTGVVLRFEGCLAVVTADIQDRMISILVADPAGEHSMPDSKRRLLAVIRSDFERIHREISKLEVTEKVPYPGKPGISLDYRKLTVLEQKGRRKIAEVIGDQVIDVDIVDLLNGVDIEEARPSHQPKKGEELPPVSVFCSYSHKDDRSRARLEAHLKLLQREGAVDFWHDRRLGPGEDWAGVIHSRLKDAALVVCLVTADFLASDYCWSRELQTALEMHRTGKARVVPILVKPCDWKSSPLGSLQCLPDDSKPVSSRRDKEAGWEHVTLGLRDLVKSIQEEAKAKSAKSAVTE